MQEKLQTAVAAFSLSWEAGSSHMEAAGKFTVVAAEFNDPGFYFPIGGVVLAESLLEIRNMSRNLPRAFPTP